MNGLLIDVNWWPITPSNGKTTDSGKRSLSFLLSLRDSAFGPNTRLRVCCRLIPEYATIRDITPLLINRTAPLLAELYYACPPPPQKSQQLFYFIPPILFTDSPRQFSQQSPFDGDGNATTTTTNSN